jgi:predicted DNA-binding transcriptional regulator YafY
MNAITSVVIGSRIRFNYDNDVREVVVDAIKTKTGVRAGEAYIVGFDAVRGQFRTFRQCKMSNLTVVTEANDFAITNLDW